MHFSLYFHHLEAITLCYFHIHGSFLLNTYSVGIVQLDFILRRSWPNTFCLGKRNILMVVTFDQEKLGITENVLQVPGIAIWKIKWFIKMAIVHPEPSRRQRLKLLFYIQSEHSPSRRHWHTTFKELFQIIFMLLPFSDTYLQALLYQNSPQSPTSLDH
jgi:hypothetical protein